MGVGKVGGLVGAVDIVAGLGGLLAVAMGRGGVGCEPTLPQAWGRWFIAAGCRVA